MPDPATWRPKSGEIPAEPGVYRFIDSQDRVIYVGKAISLRSRLASYFQAPTNLHPRTRTMVFSASRVEWTVVRNELEALQLEYTWIKQFDPRFNVKYRDDKSYPWLIVTDSDEFPRVFVGRGAKRKGWKYFGPYSEAWAIRDSVDTLLGVFPMRSCSAGVFRSAHSSGRPCLMGYIDKCSAPCVGKINTEDHRRIVEDFCSVVDGHASMHIRALEAQMVKAAEEMEYERAAGFRDKVEALKKVNERNAVVLEDSADIDLLAIAEDALEVAAEVFHVRQGRILAERSWVAERSDDAGLPGLVEAFLLQMYADVVGDAKERKRAIPPEILVPALPDSASTMVELLESERGGRVRIRTPKRGDKRTLMETATRNANQALQLHKTRRASDLTMRSQALAEIADVLDMDEAPLRIECYDISHIQGTNTVASMVVFEDGLPVKTQYRHFAITSVSSNDIGAMKEVLARRLARLRTEQEAIEDGRRDDLVDSTHRTARRFSYAPSLIVVDGGAPQAGIARRVVDEMGFESIMVCGLAKRLEEVWIPGEEYPLILPRTSEALYLLQRIRDESHRFAITYHRQRRSRSMVESVLDSVIGLGEVKRKALMRVYPSLKRLRLASEDDIARVPGFGAELARRVVEVVADKPDAVNMATGEIVD